MGIFNKRFSKRPINESLNILFELFPMFRQYSSMRIINYLEKKAGIVCLSEGLNDTTMKNFINCYELQTSWQMYAAIELMIKKRYIVGINLINEVLGILAFYDENFDGKRIHNYFYDLNKIRDKIKNNDKNIKEIYVDIFTSLTKDTVLEKNTSLVAESENNQVKLLEDVLLTIKMEVDKLNESTFAAVESAFNKDSSSESIQKVVDRTHDYVRENIFLT